MDIVYIYVIGQECGPVKVGISQKPWDRVATIGTSAPFKVSLLYCYPAKSRTQARFYEEEFHEIHFNVQLWGEWFKITPEAAIAAIQASLELEYPYEDVKPQRRAQESSR